MNSPWKLFEAYGVELEYMIVDAETLDVLPAAEEVLRESDGTVASEVVRGDLAWSNELAAHVIELKTNGPAAGLHLLNDRFQEAVRRINGSLRAHGARLMPTAMHPWMDPSREMRLWPHENSAIYRAYDRIFSCKGHGWTNLQSTHLNLPFHGDVEFGKLHAAIRVVLPILPALAASSPLIEGRATGLLDNRLETYRHNQDRLPIIAGRVIPEAVFTRADYTREIFEPIERAIAPHDTEGVLESEFLNSRGAIARFSRGSIEIRLLDIQECPRADLAVLGLVVETLKALVEERWAPFSAQACWSEQALEPILNACIADGGAAPVEDPRYLELFGFPSNLPANARELWLHLEQELFGTVVDADPLCEARRLIVEKGTLARRILTDLRGAPEPENMRRTYAKLCECLDEGRLFIPSK